MAQDASESKDSVIVSTLPSVIVTAEKFENQLYRSSSAINYLEMGEINSRSLTNSYELLGTLPGFSVYSKDGLSKDPVITTRGFYGGGEADYTLFLLDGMVLNDLESGLINWNLISLKNIQSLEVLRGGASALYGDAAIGGIINAKSRIMDSTVNSISVEGGNYGFLNLDYSRFGKLMNANYSIYLNHQQIDGFRMHSKWKGISFGGSISFKPDELNNFSFYSANQLLDTDEPGPISEIDLNSNRSYSAPYYMFDNKDENRYNFQLNYQHFFNNFSTLSANISYALKISNNKRTFTNSAPILDPINYSPIGIMDTTLYGDTKERKINTNNFNINLNYFLQVNSINSKFNFGFDNRVGISNSKYYDYYNGFEVDYINSLSSIDKVNTDGYGDRINYSFYLNQEYEAIKSIKILLGLRYDIINDKYNSSIPDSTINSNNYFFSPKIGFNAIIINTENILSSIYLNLNRSIKAPTLDQLTDLKQLNFVGFIPVGEDDFMMIPIKALPFSNSLLKPQKSLNYEIGAYYFHQLTKNLISDFFISVYQTDIEDEIDFDLNSFKYQNINNTRHRGSEASIKLNYLNRLNSFINYTFFDVRFRSGSYENNMLKGIPRNVLTAGFSYTFTNHLLTSASLNYTDGIYLDDDNSQELPAYYYINASVGYSISFLSLKIHLRNIFDNKYIPAGYLLNGDKYYYPAVGRTIMGSINVDF